MPPAKSSSRAQDDGKAELSSHKDRAVGAGSAKMRRGASQTGNSTGRDLVNPPTSAPSQQIVVEAAAPTLNWSTFDRNVLHAYRRQHDLNTPNSFTSTFHSFVLSHQRGIGKYSPTMRKKGLARRQAKEQLALATRKHFNGVGVQENDVIVDFICKIRNEKILGSVPSNRLEPPKPE